MMVGDRADTDGAAGPRLGSRFVLVLSGVTAAERPAGRRRRPTSSAEDLAGASSATLAPCQCARHGRPLAGGPLALARQHERDEDAEREAPDVGGPGHAAVWADEELEDEPEAQQPLGLDPEEERMITRMMQ